MTSAGDPTTGGAVERVPLKVVPIYVHPIIDEPEPELPEEPTPVEEPGSKRSTPLPWIAAVILALATIGVHIAAIVVASAGDFPRGTLLGYIAIALSVLAVLVGVVAAILGRGRLLAILAMLVGLLANPLILLVVLRFLSGLQTS